MITIWLFVAALTIFSLGSLIGYIAGRSDGYDEGYEDRARIEWDSLDS